MTEYRPVVADDTAKHHDQAQEVAMQLLRFSVGDEVFAIDITPVREIVQNSAVTVVPLMPKFVRGVMNLRGAVVPVIDIAARLGRPVTQMGKKTCVVVVDVGPPGDRVELGLLVDAVSEVIDIFPSDIEPAPAFGASITRAFIHGLCRVGPDFIVILDVERALCIDDMADLVDPRPAP